MHPGSRWTVVLAYVHRKEDWPPIEHRLVVAVTRSVPPSCFDTSLPIRYRSSSRTSLKLGLIVEGNCKCPIYRVQINLLKYFTRNLSYRGDPSGGSERPILTKTPCPTMSCPWSSFTFCIVCQNWSAKRWPPKLCKSSVVNVIGCGSCVLWKCRVAFVCP